MTQTVSIRLDGAVLGKVDALTKAIERSAWLMAHAVEQYVEHEAWQSSDSELVFNSGKSGFINT